MFGTSRTKLSSILSSLAMLSLSSSLETSSYESLVHTTFQRFCEKQPVVKRATLNDILYAGNLGTKDQYGCNLMLIDDSLANEYPYTVNMTNIAWTRQSCVCWLKIGPDGGVDGFFEGKQVLNFTLPPQGHRMLAVDENTIGGCTCNQNDIPLSPYSQFGSTWLEFEMATKDKTGSRNGWSGADASCLVSAKYGLDIPGLQVCSQNNMCSTIYAGGTGVNAYLAGMEDADGIGIIQPPGKVRLVAHFGYHQ